MNQMFPPPARATTRTADGWPRISWTHQHLDRMVEAGLLGPTDRVELIGGDIVPMPPKGIRHERVRRSLAVWMYQRLRPEQHLLVEPGWRPAANEYLEPDLLIVPASSPGMEITGGDVLLAVELGESSFGYDTIVKRDTYARLGVREYWVVHASKLDCWVYGEPAPDGYRVKREVAAGEGLTPGLVAEVAVDLAGLGIG